MRGTLFELFGERVPAYFGLLAIGFALAIYLAQRSAKRMALDHQTIVDLGLYSILFGLLGGRLLHVVADGYFWNYFYLCVDPSQAGFEVSETTCARIGAWDEAAGLCRPTERDCLAWAAFWRGGLTYYGGLIAASAFGLYFLKREGFPRLRGVDLAGMTIPVGLFFGRLGCFLGGCCFGRLCPADSRFAVSFPPGSDASDAQWRAGELASSNLASLPVYPAQLFEAAGCLAIAGLCMFVVRPRKRFDGQVMLAFLGFYAVLRFVLEFVRADDRGGFWGLSTSQWISLAAIAVVSVTYTRLARKSHLRRIRGSA